MQQLNNGSDRTLGQRIKAARMAAGLTQEQLALALTVSRQAITKWEADRGMPDIDNLKGLSQVLGISLDYLLSDETVLDMKVLREAIHISAGSLAQKTVQKNAIVKERFPESRVYALQAERRLTKAEKIVDNLLGFFTDIPFGMPQMFDGLKNMNTSYFLVEQGEKTHLVAVTDEFLESRKLSAPVTAKRFEIGGEHFTKGAVL